MDEITPSEPKIEESKQEPAKIIELSKEEPDSPELKGFKKIGITVSIVIILCTAGLAIFLSSLPHQSEVNFCGPDKMHYGLELSYYDHANTSEGELNRTIPILAQTNCLTWTGVNDSSSIYAINDTALFEIFNAISLDRCKGAGQTFKNDIVCDIWNGTEWNATIFRYEG